MGFSWNVWKAPTIHFTQKPNVLENVGPVKQVPVGRYQQMNATRVHWERYLQLEQHVSDVQQIRTQMLLWTSAIHASQGFSVDQVRLALPIVWNLFPALYQLIMGQVQSQKEVFTNTKYRLDQQQLMLLQFSLNPIHPHAFLLRLRPSCLIVFHGRYQQWLAYKLLLTEVTRPKTQQLLNAFLPILLHLLILSSRPQPQFCVHLPPFPRVVVLGNI